MKKVIIASVIVGAAVAGLIFYLRDQFGEKKTSDQISDAAGDAYGTMNTFVKREEKAFDPALN